MTSIELAEKLGFKVINTGDGNERNIEGVYCCDLLSIVMGKAKANDAWITVMGNINSVAVAVLSDVCCVILSENMSMDSGGLSKADMQNVCVLSSELSTYEIAMMISKELSIN